MKFKWRFITLLLLKLVFTLLASDVHDLGVLPRKAENGDRGSILLMFQGCGVKTSLFKLGLRLGQELRSEGYIVTLVTILEPGEQDKVGDDGVSGFPSLDIQSEDVLDECHSLKAKVTSMTSNKVVGTQQLLGLLSPQRILCEALLANETTMAHLRNLHINMIISESFGPCHVILSNLLGGISIANFLVVSPLSLPPAMFPQLMYSNTASLLKRFQDTAEVMSLHLFYRRLWGWYSQMASKYGISTLGSTSGFATSYSNASLWFLNADPVLDYPLTLPPNFIFLGDLTSHPPQPIVDRGLRQAIEQFRPRGHIVVSISTIARQLKGSTEETLVSGLSRLPFQTLWRNERPSLQTSPTENIYFTGWMEDNDMNDLLGLNGTVAFITTGGRCGIMEAIYHGVPMLCLPLMSSDHTENCAKVKKIGVGIVLDIHSFTADDVYDAVMNLVDDTSFLKNALQASQAFKSKPQSPGQRIVFWVEHVLQNGDQHLKHIGTGSFFTLIQYTCVDLVVQLLIIAIISTLIYFKIFKPTLYRQSS